MAVTRRGIPERSRVVAGVVAEHVDPDEARRALHDLEGHGFSVVAVPEDVLAAASQAARGLSATDLAERHAIEARAHSTPRDADVAEVMAAIVAGLAAFAQGTPVPAVQPGPAAEQLQPAFDAVLDVVTRPTVPPPAWFSQATRNAEARQAFLDEFGALTSEDIASLAGSQAANRRATAHRWQAERKILAVNHHGQLLFPGFQFDPETGRPKLVVAETLAALPARMTGWALALWWATPIDLLDWSRPVDLLDTAGEDLVRAARAEAADWAQSTPA